MSLLYPRRKKEAILDHLPVSSISSREEAQSLYDYIGLSAHSDLRMQAWSIAAAENAPYAPSGYASNPKALAVLKEAVTKLGGSWDDASIVTLPDSALGDERFAVVESECPVYADIEQTERMDTALPGDALVLLREESGRLLLHSANGYVGWADPSCLKRVNETRWLLAMNVTPPDAGALDKIRVKAMEMLETKYVWGGLSGEGIDCSGFAQTAYFSAGVNLPRDADQQFLCGRITAVPGVLGALRMGDLLFFNGPSGRISHVAIARDQNSFIHAEDENHVCVRAWEEKPNLVERFVCGKRILH